MLKSVFESGQLEKLRMVFL